MNINIQLYGMFILILLFIFHKSHRTLQLYTEKVFCRVMYISMINLTLDILSIVMLNMRDTMPEHFVKAVCKMYVISLVWEALFALHYVLTDVYTEEMHRLRLKRLTLLAVIQSVIIIVLPIHIYENLYTYGPAVLSVYIFAIIYIGSILVICLFNRRLSKRRSFAVGLWMFIWIIAAAVQYMNNEILLVGFASAIGVLILFVVMENPEANLDRKLGCFNSYALSEYIGDLYGKKTPFSALEISFCTVESQEDGSGCFDDAMQRVLDIAESRKDVLTFRTVRSDILIIVRSEDTLYWLAREISSAFAAGCGAHRHIRADLVPHAELLLDANNLRSFLAFIRSEFCCDEQDIFIAEDDAIREYKEQNVIEREITDAIAEDRVEVFLQPIFSNKEKRFTSAEALVRIRKRDGSLLSPGVFIPVAEESGLIVQLGERVFEKVCEFLKTSAAVQLGLKYIEVNLSVVQCEMKDLADRLIAIIEKYGISPKLINLEITESVSVTARNTLLDNMNRLIEYGFTFSLDDFGKGESNLMYVVEMPVSLIKLDYDMSKAFFSSPKAQQVVRAVVGMAHNMDLKLVAEGIETEAELDGMYNEDIDYIQGYYYSKPLPMQEYLEFMRGM